MFSITIFGRSVSIRTKNPETKFCLSLTFEEDDIFISMLEKCGITGSQSLKKVEELATIMPNIKTISLTDASSIEKCNYIIDLALLKILTKGESWYNSLGYTINKNVSERYETERYESEVKNNKKIINMDCKTFFDKVFRESFKKYMDKNSIKAIKARIQRYRRYPQSSFYAQLRLTEQNKLDNPNYIADITREYKLKESRLIEAMPSDDSDITVKEYFENVLSNLSCDNSFWLSEILYYISKSGIIQYDNSLSKKIDRKPDLSEPIREELSKGEGYEIPEEFSGGKQKTRRKRRKYASWHLSKRTKPKRKYSGTRRR